MTRTAAELPAATHADLARLNATMRSPADTSEIPERTTAGDGSTVHSAGTGGIREAVLAEIGRQGLSRYRLWKAARAHSRTLPESAVYEFLRGERSIGLAYIDAILTALGLEIRPSRARRSGRTLRTGLPAGKARALVEPPGRRA